MTTLKHILTAVCVLAICATALVVLYKCSSPDIPDPITETEEVLVIDSVAVQSLTADIRRLENLLKAKPKVIVINNTIHDTLSVTDTLSVYPVGSHAIRRDYPFSAKTGKDSLELKVNTDLYAFVYTDNNNNFFYEDSLRVWLTDINIYKHTEIPAPKSIIYLMGGASFSRYQQNIAGQTITQTDIQPNIGIGYTHGILGGYVLGAPNGAGVGLSVNMSQVLWNIFH